MPPCAFDFHVTFDMLLYSSVMGRPTPAACSLSLPARLSGSSTWQWQIKMLGSPSRHHTAFSICLPVVQLLAQVCHMLVVVMHKQRILTKVVSFSKQLSYCE